MIATDRLISTWTVELAEAPATGLRRWNGRLGLVRAGQSVAVLALATPFALTMWLQYRRVGRWTSSVFGERAHFMLSLVAKSAPAA